MNAWCARTNSSHACSSHRWRDRLSQPVPIGANRYAALPRQDGSSSKGNRRSITKRVREQNRVDKAERKTAKRQERKAQHSKPPTDPASERIELLP